MANRPPLPAELRRRVLVEAGHRCAIHTCRHPAVDVHHITPWERCQEHAYDNLIALCPNCHRRADAGEIDRKSLQMYKARLLAGVTAPDCPAVGSLEAPGERRGASDWSSIVIAEKRIDPPPYEIEIEVPEFNSGDLADTNVIERAWALGELNGFRSRLLASPDALEIEIWNRGWFDSLSGSFEVLYFAPAAVSLRYSLLFSGAGAAHPNGRLRTVTIQRNPTIRLALRDLFHPRSPYLQRLSEISTRSLSAQLDNEWVSNGAAPNEKNFTHFNLTSAGLLLTFPEYQVASYAAGPQYVTVPWIDLRDLLNPLCAVTPNIDPV